MKERKVNGIPIQEIWARLGAEFPECDVKNHPSTRQYYVPVEKIEERLNSVVGMENWNFVVGEPQICRFGQSGHESCIVSGRLVLYDDDWVPIVRSTCGGSDIVYPKESDRPTSVANAVDSAVQDVFKRCAKRFGIAKKEKDANHSAGDARNEQEKLWKAYVLEPFRALPKGGVKAKISVEDKACELIIWNREWEELHGRYEKQFSIGSKINEISFYGVEKKYRGQMQLEFVRLATGTQNRQGAA